MLVDPAARVADDLRAAAESLLDELSRQFLPNRLLVLVEEGDRWVAAATEGLPDENFWHSQHLSVEAVEQVWTEGTPRLAADCDREEGGEMLFAFGLAPLYGLMCAPLRLQGRPALAYLSRPLKDGVYQQPDLQRFVELVGAWES